MLVVVVGVVVIIPVESGDGRFPLAFSYIRNPPLLESFGRSAAGKDGLTSRGVGASLYRQCYRLALAIFVFGRLGADGVNGSLLHRYLQESVFL